MQGRWVMTTPRKPKTLAPLDNEDALQAAAKRRLSTISATGRAGRTQAQIMQELSRRSLTSSPPSPPSSHSPHPPILAGAKTPLPPIASKELSNDDISLSGIMPKQVTQPSLIRASVYMGKARPSLSELNLHEIGVQVKPTSVQRRGSSLLQPIGADDRARAVAQGLPPLVALATQISTSIMKNIVAYRGSGPIPPGLYHAIFLGTARPKPVSEKAKSSTFGPMEGYAVQDPRNGRYEKGEDGKYALRPDQPPNLEGRQMDMSLRDLFNDMGTKYKLLGSENGVLRFCQINHPYEEIKNVEFRIDLKERVDVDPEILKNYRLISSHFDNLGKSPEGTPFEKIFEGMNLDARCPVSVKHPKVTPEDPEPMFEPIIVLGDIVRDCDMDTITDPPDDAMTMMFGAEKYAGELHEKFLRPFDMSPHFNKDEAHDVAEQVRADAAIDKMIKSMLEINERRWEQYNSVKNAAVERARENLGGLFNEKSWTKNWELENIHLKPFVLENLNTKHPENFGVLSAMVVTVGKGTPMQLYQALEINVIEKKIFASQHAGTKHAVTIADLDSYDAAKRNAALRTLHKQKIPYDKDTIARAFIQHPSECHNEHYTCPRGPLVMVSGRSIFLGDDAKLSDFVAANKQYQPINPMWIRENSLGNKNAAVWVKHFLANYDQDYKNNLDVAAVKHEVDQFLRRPENNSFVGELQKEFKRFSGKAGVVSAESYLKTFHNKLYNEASSNQADMRSSEERTPRSPSMGSHQ
jgi:hypothetical protein